MGSPRPPGAGRGMFAIPEEGMLRGNPSLILRSSTAPVARRSTATHEPRLRELRVGFPIGSRLEVSLGSFRFGSNARTG